ncbi:MAG: toll/interleukin-1 receptor domain-containing protein [Anaerolineales bacterium]|nr:toll/interleukin-1 receptor domain-containing protein [Anaerolineales bacterium]
MNQLFISYSRKDTDFARKLAAQLETEGLEIWVDWEDIPPSVDWMKEIQKGIEESDIFLFIVSPDSICSKVCAEETAHAVANGKRIIPVIARDIDVKEAPPAITHLNWIFFSRPQDTFEASFQKILTSIRTDFEWTQVHSRLQIKALEWERSQREDSFLLRGKDLQDAEAQLAVNSRKDPKPTELQVKFAAASRSAENERAAKERAKELQIQMEQKVALRLRRLTYLMLGIFTIAFVVLFFWLNEVTSALAVNSIKDQMLALVETSVCFIDGNEYAAFLDEFPVETDAVYESDYYSKLEFFMLDVIDTNENVKAETILYTIAAGSAANEYLLINSTDVAADIAYKTPGTASNENSIRIAGLESTATDTTVYTDEYGSWISACSPILNSDLESVGALCADFNAQLLEDTRQKITSALGIAFLAIYPAMIILVLFGTRSMSKMLRKAE